MRVIRDKQRAGFTLIELLLVMVILGVMAAVVVPRFAGQSQDARIKAAITGIAGMETALDAYEIQMGGYPQTEDGLEALMERPTGDEGDNWKGPYLRKLGKDPWGNDYIYEYPGRNNEYGYDLSSAGPDGQEGTDDDIHNWEDESDRARR
ncbi:MAG: type II secretion system major pseudopilin GspG [Planctomycetota bacterium]|jgi:general secretion pathway protein G